MKGKDCLMMIKTSDENTDVLHRRLKRQEDVHGEMKMKWI